nr:MAG TPA: hypothetical protein [Caudoviricetes sp.]
MLNADFTIKLFFVHHQLQFLKSLTKNLSYRLFHS